MLSIHLPYLDEILVKADIYRLFHNSRHLATVINAQYWASNTENRVMSNDNLTQSKTYITQTNVTYHY